MHRPVSRLSSLCLLVLVLAPAGAPAAPNKDEDALGAVLDFYAQELVTTAGKSEQRRKRVSATLEVVSRDDIRLSGARTVPELLRLVPGIDVITAFASDSSVGIRGFADPIDQTYIVLIDGRSAFLDFIGTTFFELLPVSLEEIDRIEIIRGPSSTIWGANAASGVINIITRRPADLAGTTLTAEGGEDGTYHAGIIQAGDVGRVGYVASASYDAAGSWEGNENNELSVPRVRLRAEIPAGEGRIDAVAGWVRLDGPVLSDLGPIGRGGWVGNLLGVYTLRGLTVRGFYVATQAQVELGLLGTQADVSAGTLSLDAFETWTIGDHRVTAGTEYRRLTVSSELAGGGRLAQNLWGVYAQATLALGSHAEATLGLRYDAHPLTSPQLSPRIGLVWEPWTGHVFRCNYASAFHNPSLTEFYIDAEVEVPFPITLEPNLDLEPEHITTAEVGYRFQHTDRVSLDLTLFRDLLDDHVLFNPTGTIPETTIPNRFQFQNVSDPRRGNGVALSLRGRLGAGVSALLAYTYEDVGVDETDGLPERWPRHKVAAAIRYVRPRGFEGQLAAERVGDWSVEEGELPGYTVVWGKASYPFLDGKLALEVYGQNLLDDRHKEFPLGEELGRRVGAGLVLRLP